MEKKKNLETELNNKKLKHYEKPRLVNYPKVKRIYGAEVVYFPGGTA